MKSPFLQLNAADLFNGFVVAFFSTALSGIIETLDLGSLPSFVELKAAAIVGLTSGLAYLLKNLLTNSQGEILTTEG